MQFVNAFGVFEINILNNGSCVHLFPRQKHPRRCQKFIIQHSGLLPKKLVRHSIFPGIGNREYLFADLLILEVGLLRLQPNDCIFDLFLSNVVWNCHDDKCGRLIEPEAVLNTVPPTG